MDTEGVTIRPLRHMLGEAEFNEVFLDDVYVPDELRIGEVDGGWKVAMATLSYERVALATGRVNVQRLIGELIAMVRESDHAGDPVVRRKVASLYARAQVQRVNGLRALASMENGTPGPGDVDRQAVLVAAGRGAGRPRAARCPGSTRRTSDDPWLRLAYQARGTSIAGGTTFIQRNIVAERVLGLPR